MEDEHNMVDYISSQIEEKWQRRWEELSAFARGENTERPKYYVLEMFPYPSGRIHMGHLRNYTIGDVIARFKRAQGFNVMYPMGWDSFGLPAENAAIEQKVHPAKWTHDNIANMKRQLKRIGLSYDWQLELTTCSPDYYVHEQKIFLRMLAKGLAYRKESFVNWDPVDQTVLANEQVIDGKGWRSGAKVERKKLAQWFLAITKYADTLLAGLDDLKNWPDGIKLSQENWIGKSEGALIHFALEGSDQKLDIFSTRPETLFGASFCAVSVKHPLAEQAASNNKAVAEFIDSTVNAALTEEEMETMPKKIIDTGFKVLHPFSREQTLPVYIANFIIHDYGTGAIFGCPAHDARDFMVATTYGLPIKQVVKPDGEQYNPSEAYTGYGVMINSEFLDGYDVPTARNMAIVKLRELGVGEKNINYRLRDWGVSRQRYWGCPIPIIYCDDCGIVPVPEEQLPVTLPDDITLGKTGNPLADHPSWSKVACPNCSKQAKRETDTFDTFFESSWYFARYCSPDADNILDKEKCDYWLPVDQYIGGSEHAVLHLLYARFFTYAMRDLGLLGITEPFKGLLTQGKVCHNTYSDEEGRFVYPEDVDLINGQYIHKPTGSKVTCGRLEKMSKSKKNIVDPEYIVNKYGADTARLFMMSDSPPDKDLLWNDSGTEGAHRYLHKLYKMISERAAVADYGSIDTNELFQLMHKTIYWVSEDLSNFRFNKAIARIREYHNLLVNYMERGYSKQAVMVLLQLLYPFTPHIAEELWQMLGLTTELCFTPWPAYDASMLKDSKSVIAIQINGKLRDTIEVETDAELATFEAEIYKLENIRRFIEGRLVNKVVFVKNKIVNIVLG
jgi:leucyl-tRNA synthetase